MKKTWIALMTAAVMGLALFAGCSQSDAGSGDAAPTTEATATEAPAEDAPAAEATAASEASATDTSWDDIKAKGHFILGLDDSFPPMGYTDDAGEIIGFDIDLAKAVAAEMGIEVKFQPVIWENIQMEINNKNVDVIWNGCTITDERKEVFDFSKPYMLNSQILVVKTDSPYQSQADLTGKVLGLQDGSSANIALDNHPDFKATLKEVTGYPSNDKALLDLASGRLDAVLVDVCVFGYYNEQQPGVYRSLEGDLGTEEFGIAFHKDADAFREEIQKALDKVIADGKATEISMKVFNRDVIAH